jgi:hypothetical protein
MAMARSPPTAGLWPPTAKGLQDDRGLFNVSRTRRRKPTAPTVRGRPAFRPEVFAHILNLARGHADCHFHKDRTTRTSNPARWLGPIRGTGLHMPVTDHLPQVSETECRHSSTSAELVLRNEYEAQHRVAPACAADRRGCLCRVAPR